MSSVCLCQAYLLESWLNKFHLGAIGPYSISQTHVEKKHHLLSWILTSRMITEKPRRTMPYHLLEVTLTDGCVSRQLLHPHALWINLISLLTLDYFAHVHRFVQLAFFCCNNQSYLVQHQLPVTLWRISNQMDGWMDKEAKTVCIIIYWLIFFSYNIY